MGIVIFLILASVEIALAGYCIATKSRQKPLRSLVRMVEFAIFFIFIISGVIQWSLRWNLLGFLLLVLAAIGAITLAHTWHNRKKNLLQKVKNFKIPGIVLRTVTMLLVIFIALIPLLVFPQYKQPEVTGKYRVATATYTYRDDSRVESFKNTGEKRKVNVEFWFPADSDGAYPLVVFSHGAFGVKTSNTSTFRELASNGYVVCSIDHPYHSMITIDTDGNYTMVDRSFIQEVLDVNNGVFDDETVFKIEKKWLNLRTEDINFVLNTIVQNTKDNSDKLFKHIDTSKIGLIGHSLGGAAAVQLGRDRRDIRAVINLDADLLGEYTSFKDGKYTVNDKVYPVPLLSIYSDVMKQRVNSITDPSLIIPQRVISSTTPNAFEIYLPGTNHMSLTDLPLVSPFLVKLINSSVKGCDIGQNTDKYEVINKMNSMVLEFFNRYLKR